MSEGTSTATTTAAAAVAAPPWTLDGIAAEAWPLEPLPSYLVGSLLRPEAAALFDGLLSRVARSRGALDVAIGERLEALAEGDFVIRLGYSCIGDYGREVLGMAKRTVQAMARLGLELRVRPLLREAVRRGEVSTRKAQEERKGGGPLSIPVKKWLEAAKTALEVETNHWEWLETLPPVEAEGGSGRGDGAAVFGDVFEVPRRLDAELRRLHGMRERWDELLGHLAMQVRAYGLWRDMGFANFSHYCSERLGMAARTVGQRIWLTRRFYDLPGLKEAMREGRLSYEKARLVAGVADESTVAAWISKAEEMKCIALEREIDAAQEAQACARGDFVVRVPERVGALVSLAFRTARKVAGRWLPPAECLVRLAEHFIETWKEALKEKRTRHRKVRERDEGWCQVPGCSRPADHVHHIVHKSQGGTDDPENLVSVCAVHHLHGLHMGYVRVRGRAPDALVWELGPPDWAANWRALSPSIGLAA